MANVDKPRGFHPVQTLSGAPVSGKMRVFQIDAAFASAIGVGDPVVLGADGNVELMATNGSCLGVAQGFGSAAGVQFGDADGFDPDNLDTPYVSAASTASSILVCLADDVVFSCQSTAIPDQDIGEGGDIAVTAIGSNTVSQTEVDITGVATNSDVRILEFPHFNSANGANGSLNDPTAANAEVYVVFTDTAFGQS